MHPTTPRQPVVLAFLRHPIRTARLVAGLCWDRRVGVLPKLLLLAAVAYAVSPLDFLADFLPVIGVMDDLGLAALMVTWFLSLAPPRIRAEHEAQLDGAWLPARESSPRGELPSEQPAPYRRRN